MRALVMVIALALVACGDNKVTEPAPDVTVEPDGPPIVGPLSPCLERPTDLPRPPNGQLPCDLLPPGFQAR